MVKGRGKQDSGEHNPKGAARLLDDLKRKCLLHTASELEHPPERVSSGLPELDRISEGGLPRGRLSELRTGQYGGASVLHAVLGSSARRGELSSLVDLGDGFDAPSAGASGVDLKRLLWIRPPDLPEALRAAELVLAAGGFGLLVLDLGIKALPAPTPASWMRLDRLVRQSEVPLLVLSSKGVVGPFAALVVEVAGLRVRWRLDRAAGLGEVVDGIDLSFSVHRRRCG